MYYVPISVANPSFDTLAPVLVLCHCLCSLKLTNGHPKTSSSVLIDPLSKFRLLMVITLTANDVLFKTITCVQLGGYTFNEEFLVLEKMNTPLSGLPFFIYKKIDLLTSKGRLQLPNMTYQLNTMRRPITKECPTKVKQA